MKVIEDFNMIQNYYVNLINLTKLLKMYIRRV